MNKAWEFAALATVALAMWVWQVFFRAHLKRRWRKGGRSCEGCGHWKPIEMDCGECIHRRRYVWAWDKACRDWWGWR